MEPSRKGLVPRAVALGVDSRMAERCGRDGNPALVGPFHYGGLGGRGDLTAKDAGVTLSRSLDHSVGATGSGPARSALPRSGFVHWPNSAAKAANRGGAGFWGSPAARRQQPPAGDRRP
jgi:hypothetical protein